MSSFKTYNAPSVWTTTWIGPAETVTQPSTTVTAVSTHMSTGPGDKQAALNFSTSHRRASTTAEGDPPTTTDDTCSTNVCNAAGPKSSRGSTTERVTTDCDSDALSSPLTTVDDPVAALSTSSRTDALTTPPASDTWLEGRTAPEKNCRR